MACQLTFGLPAVTGSTSCLSCDQGLRRRGAAGVALRFMGKYSRVNTDHHSIFWVRKNASKNEIKSAYRNQSGSEQRFKQIDRDYQVNMILSKEPRSCQTPAGWRLATVEEAKENLEWIKQRNLLEEWERARLLDGWIGGSGYDWHVQVGFRSCLGYMLLIQSPTSQISDAVGRNAKPYSGITKMSKEGRSAALFLCCEDWNVEVLCWLMGGRPKENAISSERDKTKEASEFVSALARELQSVRAETIVKQLKISPDSLEVLSIDIKKSLNALQEKTESVVASQITQEKSLRDHLDFFLQSYTDKIERTGSAILPETLFQEYSIEVYGFNTSVPSTWEAFARTILYFAVDTAAATYFLSLSRYLHHKLVMKSVLLQSLICCAFKLFRRSDFSDAVRSAAEDAKGDCKRFDEISRDQGFLLISCNASCDVLSPMLCQATKDGDVDLVQWLVQSDANPSEIDRGGKAAMHYAAEMVDESKGFKITEMLLTKDRKLANIPDSEKQTPLHAAVIAGRVEMCKFLCTRHHARLDLKDKQNRLPLHYALRHKQQNKSLIEYATYPLKHSLVDEKDNDGNSPLDYAIQYKADLDFVLYLLTLSGQRKSYFKKLPHTLQFYLHESLRLGYGHLIRDLVSEGADPFEPDDEDRTALHRIAENIFHRSSSGDGYEDNYALMQELIDKNKEKASAGDKYGRNVLHVAAFLGRTRLCRRILENNRTMLDTKDRDGQSAIFYAVAGAHDDPYVLKCFLSSDQDSDSVFVSDSSQATPLHVAAASGNLKMLKRLLSLVSERKKEYVEAADVLGQTALHRAASGGHAEVVEKLLDSGARPLKQRDCNGKTALHFAGQADGENAVKIAKLLLNKCESDEERSLLLFASHVGIGLSNPSLEDFIKEEKKQIHEKLKREKQIRVAARLGDIDMTREFITRGAKVALLEDKNWEASLTQEQKENVRKVREQIKANVEQGSDKPALEDSLGRSPFANGLALLFLNPFVRSPITVGISGKWGMGKTSVMAQTEIALLKTAAQLAFSNKLSVIGKRKRREIANGIKTLEAKRWTVLNFIDNILCFIKRVMKLIAKMTNPRIFLKLCSTLSKLRSSLQALWEESAPFNLSKFNEFLDKKYEPRDHQILKSMAVIDKRDLFDEDEESGSRNQTVAEMPSEEYSLQGTAPSILTVQYNAWHYRNETEAWAGLTEKITEEIEATMTVAHKLKTSLIYNWRKNRGSILFKVIFPVFRPIFLTIIAWLAFGTAYKIDIMKLKFGGRLALMIVVAQGLVNAVISFVKPISSQVGDHIRQLVGGESHFEYGLFHLESSLSHSKNLGYHQKVIDDINFLKGQLHYKRFWMWEALAFIWCCITWSWNENYVSGTNIPKMPPASGDDLRIIVLVDDLDRCDENVILQLLSAVNLVLTTCEINVILSMENSMIQRAIIRKYGSRDGEPNNNKSNEDIAVKYLKKIIQLPLHLPDPSDEESRDFLLSQLGKRDRKEGSIDEKRKTCGHKKANPKFHIGTSSPEKPKQGREETKKGLEESSGAVQETDLNISGEKKSPGDLEQGEDDLDLIIRAMVIPNYTQEESKAFDFLRARCTGSLCITPREWKCLLAYHRLTWNIMCLNRNVDLVEGWQVQLIVWIFVCWQWRHQITTLIKNWNKLGILRKWKGVEENTIEPSLREIVEDYYERWLADQEGAPTGRAEEQEEWIKLRDILQVYNVSMDGIQTFQKFRFFCEPGHLLWPLSESV